MSNVDRPDDYNEENFPFLAFKKKQVTNGRTDGPFDQPTDYSTDTTSYRDARTHLKRIIVKT